MQIGWFSNYKYYSLNGDDLNGENIPFNNNRLILELKLKALQVANHIYDQKLNRFQFIVSIGKEILDENLKMGFAYLMHLNNGSMHSKFFDKNSKTNYNFNIQMLFE